jgi:hypothetical protein
VTQTTATFDFRFGGRQEHITHSMRAGVGSSPDCSIRVPIPCCQAKSAHAKISSLVIV